MRCLVRFPTRGDPLSADVLTPLPGQVDEHMVRCPCLETAEKMTDCIKEARADEDSIGGVVRPKTFHPSVRTLDTNPALSFRTLLRSNPAHQTQSAASYSPCTSNP